MNVWRGVGVDSGFIPQKMRCRRRARVVLPLLEGPEMPIITASAGWGSLMVGCRGNRGIEALGKLRCGSGGEPKLILSV